MYFLNHRPRGRLPLNVPGLPRLIRRRLSWIALSLAIVLGILVGSLQPAQAHRPHDVVTQIKLSPTYSQDQIAYSLVRGNLFKTTDGGNNWKRIVQGLDTLTPFSTLTVDQATGTFLALGTHGDGIFLSTTREEQQVLEQKQD